MKNCSDPMLGPSEISTKTVHDFDHYFSYAQPKGSSKNVFELLMIIIDLRGGVLVSEKQIFSSFTIKTRH